VRIVYDATTIPPAPIPTPSSTPSKSAEKPKPTPVASKPEEVPAEVTKKVAEEEPKQSAPEGLQDTITLTMRQLGEEAAAKAKQVKKKAIEVIDGTGEAAPATLKDEGESTSTPPSLTLTKPGESKPHAFDFNATMQSPTSTAWKTFPAAKAATIHDPIETLPSVQSPTSTAWKPLDPAPRITQHRGSEVSEASAEEIREIEEELTIKEEDENAI